MLFAQGDELFVPCEHFCVLRCFLFFPFQLGAQKSLFVLRIGDIVRVPAECSKFIFSSFGDKPPKLRIFMIGEILEWRRCCPLFALNSMGTNGAVKTSAAAIFARP